MSDEAKKVDDGGCAFPTETAMSYSNGMSLRDWFAGMALQGIISDPSPISRGCSEAVAYDIGIGRKPSTFIEIVVNASYAYADAMIERRKR